MCVCSVESEAPVCKKPRTTNVVVEQAGQTDKLLIDHITDTDSVFEEVHVYTDIHIRDVHCMQTFICVRSGSWAIRQECYILIKECAVYYYYTVMQKEEVSMVIQTTRQSNTAHPRQSSELPRVGFEPTPLGTLDRALYQLSVAGWA